MQFYIYVFVQYVVYVKMIAECQYMSDIRRLHEHLFVNGSYDKRFRPVDMQDSPTEIHLSMFLLTLEDVDIVHETFRVTAYLKIIWNDEFLTWDPDEFGNATFYHWPQNDVWKPLITLRNSNSDYKEIGDSTLDVSNENNGEIMWITFKLFTSACPMNVKYYPFDKQTCSLDFVVWGYGPSEVVLFIGRDEISQLDYDKNRQWDMVGSNWSESITVALFIGRDEISLLDYEKNRQWDMVGTNWSESITYNDIGIKFTFTVKRNPTYVIFTVLSPILVLIVLNIFVFMLPCDSGERVSYASSVFLSFAVFFTLISSVLPASVALLSIYVIAMTGQSALICVIAIVQVRLSSSDSNDYPVPKWILFLSKLGQCSSKGRKVANKTRETNVEDLKEMDVVSSNDEFSGDGKLSSENERESMTWKEVITRADYFLTLLFTVISIVTTSVCIGMCASSD